MFQVSGVAGPVTSAGQGDVRSGDAESSERREVSLASLGEQDVLWIALGVPLGVTVNPRDTTDSAVDVRLSGEPIPLSLGLAGLYAEALVPRSEDDLVRASAAYELDDPHAAIATLRSKGLLASVTRWEMDDTLYAARIISIAIGLGNSVEDPYTWTITDPGNDTQLKLDGLAYAIWAECDGKTKISEACARVSDEFEVDPSRVRLKAGWLVLAMMYTRLAFIDT